MDSMFATLDANLKHELEVIDELDLSNAEQRKEALELMTRAWIVMQQEEQRQITGRSVIEVPVSYAGIAISVPRVRMAIVNQKKHNFPGSDVYREMVEVLDALWAKTVFQDGKATGEPVGGPRIYPLLFDTAADILSNRQFIGVSEEGIAIFA